MSVQARRSRLRRVAVVVGTSAVLGATLITGSAATAASRTSAAIYLVTQEGLTAQEGARLADTFGVPNALLENGSFSYVDAAKFGQVPQQRVGDGTDKQGRPTVSQAIDFAALDRVRPIADDDAVKRASRLVAIAGLSADLQVQPDVSHEQLTLVDNNDQVMNQHLLDTAVSYRFTLGGLPVDGQGVKLRITFDGNGTVTQLSHSLRKLQRSQNVTIISSDEARRTCAALYGADVKQDAPTLGYQMPELTARQASGKGTIQAVFPQYTCNPVSAQGTQAHRLVPAVAGSAPKFALTAILKGNRVDASSTVAGGTAPYSYKWSSSTTTLDVHDQSAIGYDRTARDGSAAESVTLEVTDANGLTSTASVTLGGDGTGSSDSTPGGGGFGALSGNNVGIENTVDEWQCAQDSANGFHSVMQSHGAPVSFDWRGANAWQKDFKETAFGGWDDYYVDNVAAQWYTGHGWAGGFTFKGNHDSTTLTPDQARWGDKSLDWMQLESCEVLRDTSGTNDYFGRWGQVFTGLHMLNGFHTSAYCVGGGTGGTFANYLFPQKFLWWTLRPALTVRQAWRGMALDKEPHGVVYRSMGLIGPGGVTNIGDYFWGQGSTGPDILPTSSIGKWSITGTV